MTAKEKLVKLAEVNNGILTTKQVTQANISRYLLGELVAEGVFTNVQRGVYVTENGYADDYFLLQQRFAKLFNVETKVRNYMEVLL